jgi:predicted house-cleaning noncanonical NTP pyrophosphatase (MazG superfamily)
MIPYEDKVLYEECQQLIENPIETHVWTVDQTVVEELSKLFEVVMEILTLGGNSKKHLRPLGGWSIF